MIFTYVPLSCGQATLAHAIPAWKSLPLPPAARKRRVDALDAAILHRLDVGDLDQLACGAPLGGV